jgi:DNA polymerase-3 subunit epsilon
MPKAEMKEPLSDYEAMAAALDATDRYRVLRRLGSRSIIEPYDGSATRLGLFVDVETTGLDPTRDEIVELAMTCPEACGASGNVAPDVRFAPIADIPGKSVFDPTGHQRRRRSDSRKVCIPHTPREPSY